MSNLAFHILFRKFPYLTNSKGKITKCQTILQHIAHKQKMCSCFFHISDHFSLKLRGTVTKQLIVGFLPSPVSWNCTMHSWHNWLHNAPAEVLQAKYFCLGTEAQRPHTEPLSSMYKVAQKDFVPSLSCCPKQWAWKRNYWNGYNWEAGPGFSSGLEKTVLRHIFYLF